MIKNIIFDWSGVIKDCVHDQLFVVNKIFKEFGAGEISLKEFKDNWKQPYMVFYNKYLPNLTFEQEQLAYKNVIVESPKAQPYTGIVEEIRNLKAKGILMVVVSSDLPETLHHEVTSFNLENIFLDIATNVHDKLIAIENLIDKYNFNKSETIVIGDSNHEIEAGKKLGIKTMGVTWGFTSKEKIIDASPDFIVNNIDEFKNIFLMD